MSGEERGQEGEIRKIPNKYGKVGNQNMEK